MALVKHSGLFRNYIVDVDEIKGLNNKCDFCQTKCLRNICPPCRDRVATGSLLGQDSFQGINGYVISKTQSRVVHRFNSIGYYDVSFGIEDSEGFRVILNKTIFGGALFKETLDINDGHITKSQVYDMIVRLQKQINEYMANHDLGVSIGRIVSS